MAHHISGLGISPTSMDPRSHITDLYVFQKPGDPHKTILVMDINPHSPMTADAVDPESVYEFGVDTDADAATDIAFRVRFSPVVNELADRQRAAGDRSTRRGRRQRRGDDHSTVPRSPLARSPKSPRPATSGFSPGSAVTHSSPTR